MKDAKILLDQLPDDLQREVADFAEFLLAKARRQKTASPGFDLADAALGADQGQGGDPWESLLKSLDQFSDDYMAERCST